MRPLIPPTQGFPLMRPNGSYAAVPSCATKVTVFHTAPAQGADPIHIVPCLTWDFAWSRMRRHHPPRWWRRLQNNRSSACSGGPAIPAHILSDDLQISLICQTVVVEVIPA